MAKPKNAAKPIISVTVVKITPPASAGSIDKLFRIQGINTPASDAKKRLIRRVWPPFDVT